MLFWRRWMQFIYVGKCSDGAFWHILVTRYSIHIYRRYHNGRRWVTYRVVGDLGALLKMLKRLPRQVANTVKKILEEHPLARLVKSGVLKSGEERSMSRDVLRLVKNVLDVVYEALMHLDELPRDVKARLQKRISAKLRVLAREVGELDVPENVKIEIASATSVGEVVESVLTLLNEVD